MGDEVEVGSIGILKASPAIAKSKAKPDDT